MASNTEYRQRLFAAVSRLTPHKDFDELEGALAAARGVAPDQKIDRADIKKLLRLANVPTTLGIAERQLMEELDKNHDDVITRDELGLLLTQLPPAVRRLDLAIPGQSGVALRRT